MALQIRNATSDIPKSISDVGRLRTSDDKSVYRESEVPNSPKCIGKGGRVLAEYRASIVAEKCWGRAAGLLRTYYYEGWGGFSKNGHTDLGTRVQVPTTDGMGFVADVLAADRAMEELRVRCLPAFFLADDVIRHGAPHTDDESLERGREPWHSERGVGVADRLGLDRDGSRRLFCGAVTYLWWRLEGQEKPGETEPEIVKECLG